MPVISRDLVRVTVQTVAYVISYASRMCRNLPENEAYKLRLLIQAAIKIDEY